MAKRIISREHVGQRLDNYLFRELKGLPKSRVYRAIRNGEVRVNGGRIKPNYRLAVDDELRLPPLNLAVSKPSPVLSAKREQQILDRVIYQDQDLLVINKPSGMPVHGGSGISAGLIELLRVALPRSRRLELVHRLDRDTSGCLLVAKKRSTLVALHELITQRRVQKCYLTLVNGRWPRGLREVAYPLKKHQLRSGERIVRVDAAGKPALTRFRPIRRFRRATLLHVELVTGRTHQIRVHASASGYPILGDSRYGNAESHELARQIKLNRLFLHACELTVPGFADHSALSLCACMDSGLIASLDYLAQGLEG